jgi:DNA-binding NarL/FixJ family response regulator
MLLQGERGGISVQSNQGHTAVLLDQHPIWLDAIEQMLGRMRITSVGKTTDPADALELIEEHRPHLFILDVDTNGSVPEGLACLKEACSTHPSLKTVVISASEDPERIDAILDAGAVAYVLRRAEPGDLASAIRQVFTRSLYLAGARRSRAVSSVEANTVGLTQREREILQLVAEGGTNGDIAKKLWVTEQTVKFHLANIFRKLDVSNRTQASRWAHENGLLERAALGQVYDLTATG